MPPKHKLGRKRNQTQSTTGTQSTLSSKSDNYIVHSTIPNTIENDNDSSLDSLLIPSTTDVVTITANDRHYIRVSKQIRQNELERQRMNVDALLEKVHLEGGEITLRTFTTSDWRLVLQDSITTDDLQQGCISLFKQVNSGMTMTPNDVFHAVHFLEYSTIHIKHRKYPDNSLFKTIFPDVSQCRTKLTSALTKLVSHPSVSLRTAALSFLDAEISESSKQLSPRIATTLMLPQLFESMKPHEIPINGTTIEFHRRVTTIVDTFTDDLPRVIVCHPPITSYATLHKIAASEPVNPDFKPFCNYLQHLIASPACPPDCPSGISLFSKMKIYPRNINYFHSNSFHPGLEPIFSELRKNLTEELASLLDLTTSRKTLHQLLFGQRKERDEHGWVDTFENILVRLRKGRQISDLGLQSFLCFLSNCPETINPIIRADGTFSLKVDGKVKSTLELPTSFISSLVTTRPHYASVVLSLFHWLFSVYDPAALLMDFQNGWFSQLFEAVNPSKLPFTNEFLPLHTQLVHVMKEYLAKIREYPESKDRPQTRRNLNKICLSFRKITKDYLIHLSLHPFALKTKYNSNIILDFFANFFGITHKQRVLTQFRVEMRKEIDASALSSPSPPFILTSELVCHLTGDEIMNVVDRIVGLIESDSPISDDTILRICVFHTNQLKCVYLPELFRKAGRSTEQCFHTFNSLLSLPFDYFDLHPINSLLTPKPKTLQPTFDEWDDVDLAIVGIVMATIHEDRLSFKSASSQLLTFGVEVLPQLSHCASRLTLSQLEQLLTPSIDLLRTFYLRLCPSTYEERQLCEHGFVNLYRLSEKHVITQCLSRLGFFSRIVDGLLNDRLFFDCKSVLDIFLHQARASGKEGTDRRALQRTVHHFLEEGWQDAVDFVFVKKKETFYRNDRIEYVKEMMQFLGVNF
ncbi:hypothetical protein BLNAU_3036 [Blattamonas nauphoetae]|uniref:Uncharacterized protein n=1 Tax=Blattamonas nauphoetae TaxID=2049346 RepID=A0ABQ9YE41_9EUKA|nr:hypothetical protein BLNAU_3036 [Blattamonas nauphoetae]